MSEQLDLIIRPRQPRTGLAKVADSLRSIFLGPYNTKDKTLARLLGGSPVSSGVVVNEQTALNYSAVWAAVNLIAGHVGSVPLVLYKRTPDGGKTRFTTHPLYRLLHDQPNPHMSSSVFRRTLTAHKLIWGNGYAEIERDRAGRPIALWPLMPYAVQPYLEGGLLRYKVFNPTQPATELASSDILHIRGLCEDGTCGQSVIPAARESFGLGLAAERFGAAFFGNGSTFGSVITYPPGAGKDTLVRKENRDAIDKRHTGVENAHRYLALYEGATITSLGVPPNAAQFLETRQFQIEEVCRWFNIPPHKLKQLEHSGDNNIEHLGIEYVTDCLDLHWVDWEEELTLKLIALLERNQQEIEHVREGLLRGDQAARGEFYAKLHGVGAITVNEIRARENLNPVDGGDTVFVPLNMLPMDRITEYYDAIIKSKEPQAPTQTPPNGPTPAEIKALEAALVEARHQIQQQEDTVDLATAVRLAAETQANEARQALATATADLATLQATLATRATEATAAAADRDAALALAHEAERTRGTAELQATAFQVTAEQADARAREAQTAQDLAVASLAAITVERDAALTLASEAEQVRIDKTREVEDIRAFHTKALDAAVVASREADERADAAIARADAATAARDALAVEAETLRTDLARVRGDVATELERAQTHKVTMLSAMRSLFVHASERLLAKESTAARKHQQTPEKLRDWIDRFFPLHAATAREAFRPIVGPWTALTGGAPGLLLDRLVAEHLEASTTALRLVAEVDELDEMAATLERTLSRWESERADAMADALVREGMTDHG